jgi:hypothetical protein
MKEIKENILKMEEQMKAGLESLFALSQLSSGFSQQIKTVEKWQKKK